MDQPNNRFTKRRPSSLQGKKGKYFERVPVDKEKLKKHSKGEGIDLQYKTTSIRNKIQRKKLQKKEKIIYSTIKETARTELLLTEEPGFLEADPGEATTQYKQKQIVDSADITSAAKQFRLDLRFGHYVTRYTRNGRHLVLGGRQGHVAAFDWITKKLACEINVMESVHDVTWLHMDTMFAVAQKSWVYIYDNQGVELHCLKQMNSVNRLEFLPYHFLLASGSRDGELAWFDVSIGKMVSHYGSQLGRISVMTQNPSNAILCVGNSKGVVSMWSPNCHKPLVKMLCHGQPIIACAVHSYGTYMATSASNRSVKIWDVRQLAVPVHHCYVRSPAQQLAYSQTTQLAMGMGNVVEVYRHTAANIERYLRHRDRSKVSSLQFCPYEDVLAVGTGNGFSSLLVPGSAEPNFDALETNPFESKTQKREAEVKALLDKIQPELITLDSSMIAEVDVPTLRDKVQAKNSLLHIKPQRIDFKPRKTKAKGKGGTAKVIKTKKILADKARKETMEMIRNAKMKEKSTKSQVPTKDYGILNRFLPKSGKSN